MVSYDKIELFFVVTNCTFIEGSDFYGVGISTKRES